MEPKHILIVDDSLLIRKALGAALSDATNRVFLAATGSEALDVLHGPAGIQYLITDTQMPGMDGFELACTAKLKSPSLKIMIMSANTEYGRRFESAKREGIIDRYAFKPFDLRDIYGFLADRV